MACIIWTETTEPADLISKLFANEDIEAKGTALEIVSSLYFIRKYLSPTHFKNRHAQYELDFNEFDLHTLCNFTF